MPRSCICVGIHIYLEGIYLLVCIACMYDDVTCMYDDVTCMYDDVICMYDDVTCM